MKRLLIVLLMCVVPAASADDEICEMFGGIAYKIAKLRQMGVPLTTMYEKANGHKPTQKLIIDAFTIPVFDSPAIRQEVINDFAERAQLDCLREFQSIRK